MDFSIKNYIEEHSKVLEKINIQDLQEVIDLIYDAY